MAIARAFESAAIAGAWHIDPRLMNSGGSWGRSDLPRFPTLVSFVNGGVRFGLSKGTPSFASAVNEVVTVMFGDVHI